MLPVDRDPVNRVLGGDSNLERLISLNWIAAVALFVAPNLILQMITNDHVLLRPHAEVEHHIVPGTQSRAALNRNLTTAEEIFLSVTATLLMVTNAD